MKFKAENKFDLFKSSINDKELIISTTTISTTTTLPPITNIPRDLKSCDGNSTIPTPWSWSVKIIYLKTIAGKL